MDDWCWSTALHADRARKLNWKCDSYFRQELNNMKSTKIISLFTSLLSPANNNVIVLLYGFIEIVNKQLSSAHEFCSQVLHQASFLRSYMFPLPLVTIIMEP